MFAQLINRINRSDTRQADEPGRVDAARPTADGAPATPPCTPESDDDALVQGALDWIDAPLTLFDRGLVLRHANAAYCALVGKRRDELIGRSLEELSGKRAGDDVRPYFERALAGESLDVDVAHRPRTPEGLNPIDGASRVEYRPQRNARGDVVGVIAVMQRLGRRQADQVADPYNPTDSSIAYAIRPGFSAPMRAALRIAQDDLAERERKQRELIESLPLPFVFIGTDGLCKWANLAFCDAFDLSESAIHDAPPSRLAETFGQVVEQGLARATGGVAHAAEVQLAMAGKPARWHRVDFIPGFDRNGFQSGVYVLFSDIHESRLSTMVVQESEAHFRGFTENIPESIVFLDRGLSVRYVNQSFAQNIGKPREAMIGRPLGDVIGAEAADRHCPALGRALAGEIVIEERRDGFRDDDEWRELRYLPFDGEGGQGEGVYIVSRSIEDEKRAERALAERDERIHFLTDNLPAQIAYIDTELRYRYCNQRFLSDYAIGRAADILGKTPGDLIGAALFDAAMPSVTAALRGERVQFERRASANPNDRRWLRVTLVGDLAEDGTPRGIYSIAYDITDSKAAEDTRAKRQVWIESFVENFPQPLSYFDVQGVHRFANRAYANFLGIDQGDIVGHTGAQIFVAETVRKTMPGFERALGGERLHEELPLAMPDGRLVLASIDWLPDLNPDGTPRGVYCIAQDIGEAQRARLAYEESLREMQRAMDSVALPISFVDPQERLRFVNATTTNWHGRPADELIGLPIRELMSSEDYRFAEPYIRAALAGESVQYEREMRYHDGLRRWVLLRYVPTRDESGAVTGFYTTATDIQSRKKQEIALQQANALLTAHFENTPLASFTLDGEGRVTRWSTQAEALFGWRRDEAIDRPFPELGLVDREVAAHFLPGGEGSETENGNARIYVLETLRRDGSRVTCEWHIAALRDPAGRISSSLALVQDVSQRIEAERRLTDIAQRDTLTRLLNRNALEPTLRAFIERARQGGTGVAVLFLDLDHFKNINDTLGHRVGDLMLIEIARILRACVRAEDEVARIGGDEFMIVIGHARPKTIAHETAQRIISALGTPIRVENQRLSVAASIGIAVYPDHGRAPEALVRSADLAMYRAKENGKNRFEFFSAMLAQRSERRSAVKAALKLTLQRDGLRLYFQPRVRISDGRIVGAEALLRWTDPRLGVVSPKEFIGIAEESGLIHELGLYVFRKACRQLRDWQDRGIQLGVLSVNFSAHQLLVATFIDEVDRVIDETGVDPRYVEVEITETSMLFDLGVTKNVIADLKHRGMRIAIDDFGTGFSSLSHLQQLDVDTLKVDQSFIRDMLHDSGDAAITMSVISLARGLKLSTTAEGVENEQQLQALRVAGCDYYQGFLFSPAIVVEDIEALLADQGVNPHPL